MRPAAIILLILFLALAVLTGLLYFSANVTVTDIECIAEDAAEQEARFLQLREQAGAGTFTGTPFDTSGIGEAADCLFYTYTVHLRNETFLPLKAAEVQVSPMQDDLLQAPEDGPVTIPARGQGTVRAVILTKKGSHPVRELTLTYYLWGLPFSVKTAYSK